MRAQANPPVAPVDFTVECHGEFCHLMPMTDMGRSFVSEMYGPAGPTAFITIHAAELNEVAVAMAEHKVKIGNTPAGLH